MHNIEHYTYPSTTPKAEIERRLQEHARAATWQEGGSGLCHGIRWLDVVVDDYNSAEEFLRNNDRGWYDNLAVKYKHFDKAPDSKKLNELKSKLSEARRKLRETENKVFFSDFKAQYITCKECGSKMNKDYLKRNRCPICGNDMRPDTLKNKIDREAAKVKSLEEAVREEELKLAKKDAKKAKEYWLVKIEYHT